MSLWAGVSAVYKNTGTRYEGPHLRLVQQVETTHFKALEQR